MAPLDPGDDHIEGGERFLQLQPAETAAARRVAALRIFDHQPLVVARPCGVEDLIQLRGVGGPDEVGEHEGGGKAEILEQPAAFPQRLPQQVARIEIEQVEGDEGHRHLLQELGADHLAAQSVLQLEEGPNPAVAECQDLAIEQDVVGQLAGRVDHLREGARHVVGRASRARSVPPPCAAGRGCRRICPPPMPRPRPGA